MYGYAGLYLLQVLGFRDTYIFHLVPSSPAYHKRASLDRTNKLSEDIRVVWAEEQQAISRQKRDYLDLDDQYIGDKRNNILFDDYRMDDTFNDELWSQEWYLQDTRTRKDLPKLDLNVLPVYRAGITGRGVRVTILDDGIEHTHDDLHNNYDPAISYDCNEEDGDPLPRYDAGRRNSHGTRCAGEVAMSANNRKCGVGVAYDASIGGIKLLDGVVNDRVEGTALGFAWELVDVYSASWGPTDDGRTVDGPGRLAREALERGVRQGRRGLGSVYVWASGNGGSRGDNCNCDGYLTSRYTVSIGSASQQGQFPWYGEECASTLAVTYSSGAYHDQMIATTDLENACTIKHTGTSASAPLAAGIIALALQANGGLTWRDVQHLTVWTSVPEPLRGGDGGAWRRNAAGLWFSTRFGFGLMDAHGYVTAASNWTTVPPARVCTLAPINHRGGVKLVAGQPVVLKFSTSRCREAPGLTIRHLEHVEVTTSIRHTVRGQLEIHLTSPPGTRSELLGRRRLDKSTAGFSNWTFMSVTTWGEDPQGDWLLQVSDQVGSPGDVGQVDETYLTLHGTTDQPEHMTRGPRPYNGDNDYNTFNNYLYPSYE